MEPSHVSWGEQRTQTSVEWTDAVDSSDSWTDGAVGEIRCWGVEVAEAFGLCKKGSDSLVSSRELTSACNNTWLGSMSQISSSYASALSLSESWQMNSRNRIESKFLESRKMTNQSPI